MVYGCGLLHIHKQRSATLLHSEQNVQVCDATKAGQRDGAGNKIVYPFIGLFVH